MMGGRQDQYNGGLFSDALEILLLSNEPIPWAFQEG